MKHQLERMEEQGEAFVLFDAKMGSASKTFRHVGSGRWLCTIWPDRIPSFGMVKRPDFFGSGFDSFAFCSLRYSPVLQVWPHSC